MRQEFSALGTLLLRNFVIRNFVPAPFKCQNIGIFPLSGFFPDFFVFLFDSSIVLMKLPRKNEYLCGMLFYPLKVSFTSLFK